MSRFHIYLYGPDKGAIETSFEEASARLMEVERTAFEPDGSFVVSRDKGTQQLFGMLYDDGQRVQYVELRGACDQSLWLEVIRAIVGSDSTDLAVMLLPERQLQTLQTFENRTFTR